VGLIVSTLSVFQLPKPQKNIPRTVKVNTQTVRFIDLFLFFDNESTGKERKLHVQGY
jgi:hypothetical protein